MSTVLETPTSSKSRDHDIIPISRRISTSSRESDDVKKSSSKSHKISNIEESRDDENNNNHEKSRKSKKRSKSHDQPPERPQTLDLNITAQDNNAEDEEDNIGNSCKKM